MPKLVFPFSRVVAWAVKSLSFFLKRSVVAVGNYSITHKQNHVMAWAVKALSPLQDSVKEKETDQGILFFSKISSSSEKLLHN